MDLTPCVSKQLQGCSTCPQPVPALSQHETLLAKQSFPHLGPLMIARRLLSCREVLAMAPIRGQSSLFGAGDAPGKGLQAGNVLH